MSSLKLAFALMPLACAAAVLATPASEPSTPPDADQQKVCKMVVTAELGSKPFEMCMTRAEWKAKEIADAKDPGRMVCRYEEVPGTRVKNRKVCLTAAQWEDLRLRDRQEVERIQMQTCVPNAGC